MEHSPATSVSEKPLTIGALARRANVSTSMLRFYEREGLLTPGQRTASGYRLYPADAEQTLLFIRRAQRLGFSLADIKLLLHGGGAGSGSRGDPVVGLAEQRFLEIERRVTEMLVMRHELEFFLEDLTERMDRAGGRGTSKIYRDLLDQVCGHDHEGHRHVPSSFAKLTNRLGCSLAAPEREQLFRTLRGKHIHIWREDDGYSILVASQDPAVGSALTRLAASEADCHAHVEPRVAAAEEGYLFQAKGANAFLFAQLFLALESAE
jgi:DNA-binding transcriptional MerR regulator